MTAGELEGFIAGLSGDMAGDKILIGIFELMMGLSTLIDPCGT